MTGYGAHIFPKHAADLADSAIDPEVARERGYVSVDTKTRLEGPGLGEATAGLLHNLPGQPHGLGGE